jgi:hypothetical protein
MSPNEFSRVCQTMPVTGRFAGTTITCYQYTTEELSVILELRSGDRLMFNTWKEFSEWYAQQRIQKRRRHSTSGSPGRRSGANTPPVTPLRATLPQHE